MNLLNEIYKKTMTNKKLLNNIYYMALRHKELNEGLKMKEEVKNKPNIYGVYETNADSSLNKNYFTIKHPEPKWSIEFAPNCFIYTPDNRNWFNRLMQRLILGFKWKRI